MQTGGTVIIKKGISKNDILNKLFNRIKSEEYCPLDFDSIKIDNFEEYNRDAFLIQYQMTDDYSAEVGTRVLETHSHVVYYTDEKGRGKQKTVRDDVWETHWKDYESSITQRYFSIVFTDDPKSNTIDKNNKYVERFRKLSDEGMIDEPSDDKPIDVPKEIIDKATSYGATKIKNSVHIDGYDRVRERRDKITYITEAAVAMKYPCYKITYSYKDSKYESIFDANSGDQIMYSPIIERKFDNEIKQKAKVETAKYALVRNISLCVALASFLIFATSLESNIKTTVCVIMWIIFGIILMVERGKYSDAYNELKKDNGKIKDENFDKFILENKLNEKDEVINEDFQKSTDSTLLNNEVEVDNSNDDEDSDKDEERVNLDTHDFSYLDVDETDYIYTLEDYKEVDQLNRNGLVFHVFEHKQLFNRIEIPEYNDVYAYYTLLLKYPLIMRPDILTGDYFHYGFYWDLGQKRPQELAKEMFDKGFYSVASPGEILSTYKEKEIRVLIEKYGLSIKGRKQKLIEEFVKQADNDKLAKELGDEYYSVSEFGKKWMEEHKKEYELFTRDNDEIAASSKTTATERRARSLGSVAYEWCSTRDDRTRPSHKAMDGVIVFYRPPEQKPLFDGKRYNAEEEDDCRCCQLPIVDVDYLPNKYKFKVYNYLNDEIITMSKKELIKAIEKGGLE